MAFRRRQRDEMTQALAVFSAGLEGRVQLQLDALAEMQSTISELLVAMNAESGRRESDLAQALERVAFVVEQSVELIAADRADREAFLELLAEIEGPIRRSLESPKAGAPRTSTVLGGSVVVSPPEVDLADVDLVEVEAAESAVETGVNPAGTTARQDRS
jgi:hypothetical protein